MNILQKNFFVSPSDIDKRNHTNNVKYVQWVNDVAEEHWDITASKEIKNKFFWVMTEHNIQYKKSAMLNDEIEIKTFISGNEILICERTVEIYNKTNSELLAISKTKWCLINKDSNRPSRVPEEITNLFK